MPAKTTLMKNLASDSIVQGPAEIHSCTASTARCGKVIGTFGPGQWIRLDEENYKNLP